MITIISGTNRKNSATAVFAKYYFDTMNEKTEEEVKYLSLEELPLDLCHVNMYTEEGQVRGITHLQDEYMLKANKFVVISPEYNGSFPGVLKLFLDACSIREYKSTFSGKKVGLVGVASGRAGNLRGMDHLAGIFNHVNGQVMPNKLPISSISGMINEDRELIDDGTKEAIEKHIDSMIAF